MHTASINENIDNANITIQTINDTHCKAAKELLKNNGITTEAGANNQIIVKNTDDTSLITIVQALSKQIEGNNNISGISLLNSQDAKSILDAESKKTGIIIAQILPKFLEESTNQIKTEAVKDDSISQEDKKPDEIKQPTSEIKEPAFYTPSMLKALKQAADAKLAIPQINLNEDNNTIPTNTNYAKTQDASRGAHR